MFRHWDARLMDDAIATLIERSDGSDLSPLVATVAAGWVDARRVMEQSLSAIDMIRNACDVAAAPIERVALSTG